MSDIGAGAGRGGPWPANSSFTDLGLEVAGVRAGDLVETHGTPLLVVDEEDMRARCRLIAALFPRVLFAVKAFPTRAIIRMAAEEGLGLLAATDGELRACLRAGVDPAQIAFHGNNKSDEELRLAVASGIDLVIADHPEELDRLDRVASQAGAVQRVLVRIAPDVEPGTHPAIDTGGAESKFGTPRVEALDAVKRASALPGLEFAGIHAHIGSQVLDRRPYLDAVTLLLDFLSEVEEALGERAEVLDIGGGFGVSYLHEDPLPLRDLAAAIVGEVESGAAERGLPVPQVAVEPGRAIVANGVVTLYRVGATKETPGGRFLVAVDGGMSDNIRPMLYGARHAVALASVPGETRTRPATIVGRHCESGDVLAEDVSLSEDVGSGDLLAFAATGAYSYAMASNYNRVGRPAVVAVRDGLSRLLIRREDAADQERLEAAATSPPLERVETAETVSAGVLVRPARPRDAASFLEMWKGVVAEGRFVRSDEVSHSVRSYRRRFRNSWSDSQAQIVAVADGRIAGHLSIQRESHPVMRHVATLGIVVEAGRRRRGVGSALMAEGLRWARSMGVEKVTLSVYPHNDAAAALYRRFGFVEEGRLVKHSRKSYGYEDEILMSAWLGESP